MGSKVKQYSNEKLNGVIYTPPEIVDKILDDTGYSGKHILGKTILDPACGDGRFLERIVRRIIKESDISNLKRNLSCVYGWDIDHDAIKQTKEKLGSILTETGITIEWNICQKNSLRHTTTPTIFSQSDDLRFDFIVGNPPYIRIQHLIPEERQFIRNNFSFCNSGSTDIYIAFYELASRLLSDKGVCGLITPNTFFNSETGLYLRKYFEQNKNLKQITNYGAIQLFPNATTYSAIVIFDKNKRTGFLYQKARNTNSFNERIIDFSEINGKKFWQLSDKPVFSQKGRRLGDIANIHVGLTTLADKLFILRASDSGKEEPGYRRLLTKEDAPVEIESGILKPIIKVSTLKKSNEPISRFIIFPYKKINGKYRIMDENELAVSFPNAYSYLSSIRNLLDKRDNGRPNPVAWYAFGRNQSLENGFGEKILFSPMNNKPNFIYEERKHTTFYSGYCIKYSGDVEKLLSQLNSERMKEYIDISSTDFRGGWKAYNKKVIQEFPIIV